MSALTLGAVGLAVTRLATALPALLPGALHGVLPGANDWGNGTPCGQDVLGGLCDIGEDPSSVVTGPDSEASENPALSAVTSSVMQGTVQFLAFLGTMWTKIGTPQLDSGDVVSNAGRAPAGSDQLLTLLNTAAWLGLVVAVIGLIGVGITISLNRRVGDGEGAGRRLLLIMVGLVLIGGAGSLVSLVLGAEPEVQAGTVGFLQGGLWWVTAAVAVLAVIIGGIRLIWTQRGRAAQDVLRQLLTLLVVSVAGVSLVQLLVTASDAFADYILRQNGSCQAGEAMDVCFSRSLGAMLELKGLGGYGAIIIILLGLITILLTAIQVILMLVRTGLLVILPGVWPTLAAFTSSETGRRSFLRVTSWLIAFILYKPVAAIIYSAGLRLAGEDGLAGSEPMLGFLTGIMMLLLAVAALPALLRLVSPAVGAIVDGGGSASSAAMSVEADGALALGVRSWSASGAGSGGTGARENGGQPAGAPGYAGGGPMVGGSGADSSGGTRREGGGWSAPNPDTQPIPAVSRRPITGLNERDSQLRPRGESGWLAGSADLPHPAREHDTVDEARDADLTIMREETDPSGSGALPPERSTPDDASSDGQRRGPRKGSRREAKRAQRRGKGENDER